MKILHVTGFLAIGAALVVGCGSDDDKVLVRGDGGEAGAATIATAGSGGQVEPGGDAGAPDVGGTGGTVTGGGAGGEAPSPNGGAAGTDLGGAAGAGGDSQAPPHAVFNTGVDDSGVVIEGGSIDPHFTIIESPDATFTGPDAIVATSIAESYWLAQSDTSVWIAPSANQSYPGADPCDASGTYVYRTAFTLSATEAESLTVEGGWAADNSGTDIILNGVSLGLTAASYNPLSPFTITTGFVPGLNTLDFEVLDVGCPTGLRVELSMTLP